MKKIKSAKVRVLFEYDYTDYVNMMIEDKIITSTKGIKNILQADAHDDVIDDLTETSDYDNIEVIIQ